MFRAQPTLLRLLPAVFDPTEPPPLLAVELLLDTLGSHDDFPLLGTLVVLELDSLSPLHAGVVVNVRRLGDGWGRGLGGSSWSLGDRRKWEWWDASGM